MGVVAKPVRRRLRSSVRSWGGVTHRDRLVTCGSRDAASFRRAFGGEPAVVPRQNPIRVWADVEVLLPAEVLVSAGRTVVPRQNGIFGVSP
jgi:hypothetical protein